MDWSISIIRPALVVLIFVVELRPVRKLSNWSPDQRRAIIWTNADLMGIMGVHGAEIIHTENSV